MSVDYRRDLHRYIYRVIGIGYWFPVCGLGMVSQSVGQTGVGSRGPIGSGPARGTGTQPFNPHRQGSTGIIGGVRGNKRAERISEIDSRREEMRQSEELLRQLDKAIQEIRVAIAESRELVIDLRDTIDRKDGTDNA